MIEKSIIFVAVTVLVKFAGLTRLIFWLRSCVMGSASFVDTSAVFLTKFLCKNVTGG